MQVVVVDEGHAAAEEGIERALVDPLQVVLADVVRGMRFAGKDDLHRPFDCVQNPREPLRVVEDQLRTFVAGEAAREANRQRLGFEQRSARDDARGADALHGPALSHPLPHEREEIAPKGLPDRPELVVGDRQDAFPQRGIVVALEPVDSQVPFEEVGQL